MRVLKTAGLCTAPGNQHCAHSRSTGGICANTGKTEIRQRLALCVPARKKKQAQRRAQETRNAQEAGRRVSRESEIRTDAVFLSVQGLEDLVDRSRDLGILLSEGLDFADGVEDGRVMFAAKILADLRQR